MSETAANKTFRDFRKEKRISRKQIAWERQRVEQGEKPWSAYDTSAVTYERSFAPLIETTTLAAFLNKRRKQHHEACVLNIMGGAQVLKDLNPDKGIYITLAPYNPRSGEHPNIQMVAGDILSKTTWKKLGREIAEMKIEGFDLILCRPWGALMTLSNPTIQAFVLNNLWELLNASGGMLLTEVPPSADRILSAFVKWANSIVGVTARFCTHKVEGYPELSNHKLMLIKNRKVGLRLEEFAKTLDQ